MKSPSCTVYVGLAQARPTTPLNLAAWVQELENHPDQEVAQYLLQGISQGFRIGFNYPRKCQI